MNALTAEQHRGSGGAHYGRPGRIPTSVNVLARVIVDPDTNAYLPVKELRRLVAPVAASSAGRVSACCGGGIAASNGAFILTLLSHENVAVYDASMSE